MAIVNVRDSNFIKLKSLKNFILIADMPVELAIGKLCKMKVIKKPLGPTMALVWIFMHLV